VVARFEMYEDGMGYQIQPESAQLTVSNTVPDIAVALLTGGGDRPYVFGLATELTSKGATVDLIGSDELDLPEFHGQPRLNFLNLRGNQRRDAGFPEKVSRIFKYYAKLIRYAATAKPKIFHILWNNKFEVFDRTLLMLFYRLMGKKVVLTVHNVNAGRRDSKDSAINRLTLRIQYRLADHIFVHTKKMKQELIDEFGARASRITVIPFGINNSVPDTNLTTSEARQRLGIRQDEKTVLFFGAITPYKGIEYLVDAFRHILPRHDDYRLIIAGRPNNCESYWRAIVDASGEGVETGRILLKGEYIPDDETEIYFKAADVLVLPYRHVYQSGVLCLGYSFGVPILAADVGSLKDEIIEGRTGFVFKPEDHVDLAKTIERYFASDLFASLSSRRQEIRNFATKGHSWDVVGQLTMNVYADMLRPTSSRKLPNREAAKASTLD
jgi:D-inositol-3-phosphate glycosyltransferase